MNQIPHTQEELRELFEYDPNTGSLRWKARPLSSFATVAAGKRWNGRNAGKEVGRIIKTSKNYTTKGLTLHGRSYYCHRIIWKLVTGEEPPIQIDHKDHDATNNAWDNLRDGTDINHKNRAKRVDNKSGANGVYWCNRAGKWVAQAIDESGRRRYIGSFSDVDEAKRQVKEAQLAAGYDITHGV